MDNKDEPVDMVSMYSNDALIVAAKALKEKLRIMSRERCLEVLGDFEAHFDEGRKCWIAPTTPGAELHVISECPVDAQPVTVSKLFEYAVKDACYVQWNGNTGRVYYAYLKRDK